MADFKTVKRFNAKSIKNPIHKAKNSKNSYKLQFKYKHRTVKLIWRQKQHS